MRRANVLIVILLAVLALTTAGGVQFVVMDRANQLRALEVKAEQLHARRAELQQRERDFLQRKEFVKAVSDDSVQPVPGWFLGYLGNTLPEELLLSHYRLKREDDLWRVELGGTLQPTTNPATAAVLERAVASLKKKLADGPFHVRVKDEGTNSAAAGAKPAVRPAAPAGGEQRFFVEGVLAAQ